MNPNDPNQIYEYLKSKSVPDICKEIAQLEGTISKPLIARLVIEEKQMQEKFKYEKEQIQLQHKLNMELMKKQVRWIKFSAILNAIAILSAVLLGYFLSEWKSIKNPKESEKQTIQSQTKPTTSASDSESKIGNVPSQPPKNDERQK